MNEKALKIARKAARIYLNFDCTPEQAIQTAINLYESKAREEKIMQENFNKFKEVL